MVTLPILDDPGLEEVIVCREADNKNCRFDIDVMDLERDDSNIKDFKKELCELDQNIMRDEPEVYEGREEIKKDRWKRQERIGGGENTLVPQVLDLGVKRKTIQ